MVDTEIMPKSHAFQFSPSTCQDLILAWYAEKARSLPWRAKGRKRPDPYSVWLSEIMLQQTTVQAVVPYFLKFKRNWPDIKSLALAQDDDVMAAWAGLGYYARARNLLKCARMVNTSFDGKFPKDMDLLLSLPGVGPYTAGAISCIAFGRATTVVDGNIERVVARLFAVDTPLPQGKTIIRQHADTLFYGLADKLVLDIQSFPQALMDIGATVCTPKSPKCSECPLEDICIARKADDPSIYPLKAAKKKVPIRRGQAYVILDKHGNCVFEKRIDDRMLGGMLGLPTTDWDKYEGQNRALLDKEYRLKEIGKITHVFSHFQLDLEVLMVVLPSIKTVLKSNSRYTSFNLLKTELDDVGLPTLFKKTAHLAKDNFINGFRHDIKKQKRI